MLSKINEALLGLIARFQSEKGQTMSEYGLILALVAVAVIIALGALATAISGVFDDVSGELTAAVS